MKTQSATVISLLFGGLLLPTLRAESWDGTINLTRRPPIEFREALSMATKALKTDAGSFVCTGAHSKTSEAGGGWGLGFASREFSSCSIEIAKDKKVHVLCIDKTRELKKWAELFQFKATRSGNCSQILISQRECS